MSFPPGPRDPWMKQGLDKLYNDHQSANFVVIKGDRIWNIHRDVVETVSTDLYQRLTAMDPDQDGRKQLKPWGRVQFDNLIRYVYTLDYAATYHGDPHGSKEMSKMFQHMSATAIGRSLRVPGYVAAAKTAFDAYRHMLQISLNRNRRITLGERAVEIFDIESTATVFEMGRVIMRNRNAIDPVFESFVVEWLSNFVHLLPAQENCYMWRDLNGPMRPLAIEANLIRQDNGSWMQKEWSPYGDGV